MLRIGAVLEGYCGGAFGRDSYDDKRMEAIGADWVVVRYVDGRQEDQPDFCAINPEKLLEYVKKPTG